MGAELGACIKLLSETLGETLVYGMILLRCENGVH